MNPRTWLVRLSSMFRKESLDEDLDQEIQEHLRMATEENISRGMSPREAREAARRSFGGVDQMKEEFRDQRGIPAMETVARETRFAFRALCRAPGFTVLAVFTLALAIGANSAIFSAVNALLLNPAEISDPGRLVVLRAKYDKLSLGNLPISFDNLQAASGSRQIFAFTAVAKSGSFTYTGGPYPQRLSALRVSRSWFDVFGARPARGRVFTAEEDQPNNNRVVILTDGVWRRVFGGDPLIIGKTIDLDQLPYKIVGVMQPHYSIDLNELGPNGEPRDILVPLGLAVNPPMPYLETFIGVARLQPDVTLTQARTFMGVLTSRGLQDPRAGRPRQDNGWGLYLIPYTDFISGDMKTPLLILWVSVGFVLLIACANIAGLMLARANARSREFAVRAALGGSRWHLLRQLSAESALLAIGGALLGLALAYAFIRLVEILGPRNIIGGLQIPFGVSTLAFTAAAALLSMLLFGIAPAGQMGRMNTSEALKEGGRSSTEGRNRILLRSILVTAEVALALVLSIGAGLLLRSLHRLQQVDLGFQPKGVDTAGVSLPEARYKEADRIIAFYRVVINRLRGLPGVTSAAFAYPLPLGAGFEGRSFQIVGRAPRPNEPALQGQVRLVTPDFFSTLRIPVQRGRLFTDQEGPQSELVIVIDQRLARQYWPNQDPLGQQIILQGGRAATIIGLAGPTKQSDLASPLEQGVIYFSFYQSPIAFGTLLVRTAGNPASLTKPIQDAVSAVDPVTPIYDAKTMEERVSATLAGRRFTIALLALFAATAMFLAALGLYGVINYGVTQRIQEIGIRMALGAQRSQVMTLIVGGGMRLTALGLALGWIAAFAVASLLPNQLFGVSAFDPATFAGMAILLAAVTLFASAIPARRAMNLDPLEACRYE